MKVRAEVPDVKWLRWWPSAPAHWTKDGRAACARRFQHGPCDEVVELTPAGQPYGKVCARCEKLKRLEAHS